MSQVFHEIEKKIIAVLQKESKSTPDKLEKLTQLSPDQIRRGIEWLRLKNLAVVKESKVVNYSLGKNGLESFEKGLPEKQLLDLVKKEPVKISELQKQLGSIFGPAMGLAKKNNWVESKGDKISLKNYPSDFPGEKILKQIGNSVVSKTQIDSNELQLLLRRPDFLVENITKTREIIYIYNIPFSLFS